MCSKGDSCSFRHDINKRGKNDTAEPFSRIFCAAEREKCIENQKSQRQVPVEEYFDCLARITSKELAQDADLGKSALMRIARLMNSLAKGLKRMATNVQWLC